MGKPTNRTWLGLALLLGAVLSAVTAWLSGWPPPITALDVSQTRLDTALPLPHGDVAVRVGLVPAHDGLSSIEITLVEYGGEAAGGNFSLTLLDDAGNVIATETWPNAALEHNQVLNWQLPLQAQSAGQRYALLLEGDDANQVTAWGTRLDAKEDASVSILGAGESAARELRFVTRYQLTASGVLKTLKAQLGYVSSLLLAVAFMILPGALILSLWRRGPRLDTGAWAGIALALGLAIWPLLWLWLTLVGGSWDRAGLLAVMGIGWILVLVLAWQRRRQKVGRTGRSGGWAWSLALLALLVLGLALRLLAVRDLAFPPWVDASRHALITRLMAASGEFPRSYEPLLPVTRTPYHYGFHTVAASLQLLLGTPLETLLLLLGQWLNALVPLTVYAGTWLLTRHRGASLISAFLVALPFFFPAYYATWGRFTQLTGLILWPVLLALTWLLLRGGRRWRKAWPLVGLLAAGIFLIHFRLFLLTLTFTAVAGAAGWHRRWRELATAAGSGGLLVLPRLLALAMTMRGAELSSTIPDYNAFPTGYIRTGWEMGFLIAAGAALLTALPAARRRRAWAAWPLAIAAWLGITWSLLSGWLPGIPSSWLININSAYIALFVPQAMLFGLVAWRAFRWARRWPTRMTLPASALLGATLVAAALFGARQQIAILNEGTLLASAADHDAIRWLGDQAPPGSLVAVNSWRWLGEAWAGSDGGAWITPMTGLQTTTPPVDYVYDQGMLASVAAFNEAAAARESWGVPEAAAWLRDQGVTHVYVGVRGGFFDPAALLDNPAVELVYARDGAFVFAVNP